MGRFRPEYVMSVDKTNDPPRLVYFWIWLQKLKTSPLELVFKCLMSTVLNVRIDYATIHPSIIYDEQPEIHLD